jgi:NRAMP (natural resistance-associated macrophage protein)-like metal ion transporter
VNDKRRSPVAEDRSKPAKPEHGGGRALGLGLITGAADDDPSAIGTYASAGARFGLVILWAAPVMLPMMFTVVYLSSKLGQVSGRGLFQAIRQFYPRWLLWTVLIGVVIGNTIEAAADLGGMAAAINLFVPLPIPWIVVILAVVLFGLQLFGTYEQIRTIFRWLTLALFAYVGSAFMAKPDIGDVLSGTFIPHIEPSREFLSIIVAIIGTSLSAYIYTWQSNEEVEEDIARGQGSVAEREGATDRELRQTKWDVLIGMGVASLVMYFTILSTGATLHQAGQTNVESAAQAAQALRPIAGSAAEILFATGIIGVGLLAVPVMTTGAAYDIAQTLGWRYSLHAKPREAPWFYLCIGGVTAIAVGLNFLGFNPMKALVWSGIVQGLSTPPLLLLIMLMTNNRRIMGYQVNGIWTNVLGWATTVVVFVASACLLVTWVI